MEQAILRQAQALYAGAPWRDRLHVAGRLNLCPFGRLAEFVPLAGLIVDLGCGHGLFANALALESPERFVVGVEPMARKVALARAARPAHRRVEFVRGDASRPPLAGPWQTRCIASAVGRPLAID